MGNLPESVLWAVVILALSGTGYILLMAVISTCRVVRRSGYTTREWRAMMGKKNRKGKPRGKGKKYGR
jgi:hypothetical protein